MELCSVHLVEGNNVSSITYDLSLYIYRPHNMVLEIWPKFGYVSVGHRP